MNADHYRKCREHQALVRANIVAALESGDLERANYLRHRFADLLKIVLPPDELEQPKPKE